MAKIIKISKVYNNHILVPKHEKISEKQKQELLKEHSCKESDLPKIKITDVAISEMSPKAGDVFKIIRKNEGSSVFYRVVVE